MTKIVIPLTAFILPMKKQGKMRLVKMTLNNWIMIHGMRAGRMIANKRKHQIQAKIMPLVDQAMVDGLAPIGTKTKFKFDWYFPDRRTDLDNWTFTHKFIFDAFQASSVRGQVIFMPNDNLNFVVATYDDFRGIDKDNPRVEIDWSQSHD
ncbi:dTDP-glucose pyrophosphorylase [Weissella paramesenteroides]|uniref:dTDP-glucose pyrophosphorylase n=1 Tax=Weissella paramesenteroides TaxID=1249 RepID=UPI0020743A25|nr:dTDP-glucose pyrophosphorylase [Weissella paramesenteroides]MCM6765905.1 dTDP-glucose pyrophosphorylase [Weissella paramesenteroides]MCM6767280.1 dTDP-glucose pyrophosphorylase [Weissella paramesenteroides]MCM6771615.1 dTDP-glucose pyrophosphorylase [Weissella paramesenteroides]MCM6779292.1 dTDP-glucose pyrophosphorylase [Weissella paramesenteroides]MCM6781510.1 dTDP-glucose pyrophosphorylase [Weissella paramesenteroides]